MVPFWDLSGYINDLTQKRTLLTALQNLVTKLFEQYMSTFALKGGSGTESLRIVQ